MFDGGFESTVSFVPSGGSKVQDRDLVRLPPAQFSLKELSKELMVAVPVTAVVQGDDQKVAAVEPLENPVGPPDVESGVAKGTAHTVQDRSAGEE